MKTEKILFQFFSPRTVKTCLLSYFYWTYTRHANECIFFSLAKQSRNILTLIEVTE